MNALVADRIAHELAKVIRFSTRHHRGVLAAILLVTLVLGAGATQFEFHNRFTEWVPDTNPDKAAFDRAVEEVPGTVNYEVVWLELDPRKTNVTNITSPEALRGQEEFATFVRDRVPAAQGVNGPVYWVKLANYANHGNDPTYFRLPQDPVSWERARQAAFEDHGDALMHFTARDLTGALVAFPIAEPALSPEANDAGDGIRAAIAAYRASDDLEHDLFRTEYIVPVGVPSSSGIMDDVARSSTLKLAPVALLVITLALTWALRRPGGVLLGLGTVLVSTVWVVGAVGWTGGRLNLFNLAIFPLILGNGIDYAIHVLHESRPGDHPEGPVDAASLADHVGVPILFVTTTTVLGLLAMIASQSTYLTELGIWASAAMVVTALLSLTALPAAATMWPHLLPDEVPDAPRLAKVARWSREHRRGLALVVLLVSVLAAWSTTQGTYSVALMEDSFPEGDPAVKAKHRFEEKTQGGDVAFIIYEGDVASEDARAYMSRITRELTDRGIVRHASSVYDLPLMLQAFEAVEGDAPGRGGALLPGIPTQGDDGNTTDRGTTMTGAEARAAIRAMYGSPIWNPNVRNVVDDDIRTSVAYVNPARTEDTLEAAGAQKRAIEGAVAAAGPVPDDLTVHVYGFKVMAHDFLQFSITWLWVLFLLTFAATLVLTYILLRDLRSVVAVAAPMVVSGLWWLGLLPLFGISITIYLFVAVLFITSIGSDYAAYLVWKARTHGLEHAYRTTGRAVLFAILTDGAAFLVFSQVPIASAQDMMFAATLAIVTIFASTALTLPILLGTLDDPPGDPPGRQDPRPEAKGVSPTRDVPSS